MLLFVYPPVLFLSHKLFTSSAHMHTATKRATGTNAKKNAPVKLKEGNTLPNALTSIRNMVAGPTIKEDIRPLI